MDLFDGYRQLVRQQGKQCRVVVSLHTTRVRLLGLAFFALPVQLVGDKSKDGHHLRLLVELEVVSRAALHFPNVSTGSSPEFCIPTVDRQVGHAQNRAVDLHELRGELSVLARDHNTAGEGQVAVEPGVP
jgi:hypothetical protein